MYSDRYSGKVKRGSVPVLYPEDGSCETQLSVHAHSDFTVNYYEYFNHTSPTATHHVA